MVSLQNLGCQAKREKIQSLQGAWAGEVTAQREGWNLAKDSLQSSSAYYKQKIIKELEDYINDQYFHCGKISVIA